MNAVQGRGYRVTLEDVSFRPSRHSDHYVLKEVSLQVGPGEFIAVVGSNGAGKTSLLSAVAGELSRGVTGKVIVAGQTVRQPVGELLDGVGMVHQFDGADLINHLSVGRNIAIRQILGGGHPSSFLAESARWRRQVASVLNAEVELPDFGLDEMVGHLSGGRKQILSVAIAVHLEHRENPCRLLLLDEHTSRLDHRFSKQVMEYTVRQVEASGATTLMVTHRYADALQHGSRIWVLVDGELKDDLRRDAGGAFPVDVKGLATLTEGGAL